MTFRVRELPRAEADRRKIARWLAERSPAGAAAWLQAYDEAIEALAQMPTRHPLAAENDDDTTEELRHFLFKTAHGHTYRGIFTIDGNEVLVLRVRGPGQAAVHPDEL